MADTIRLHNGDVLSGAILSSDETVVRLAHPVLGEIDVPRKQVAAIEPTAEAPPEVAASAPEVTDPKPDPEPEPAAPTAPEVPLPPPAEPGLFGTGLFVGWDHSLSLGFTGTSGDTDNTNVTTQFKSAFEDADDRWLLETRYFLATRSGDRTENEFKGTLTRDWLAPDEPWFSFLTGTYEYDQFQVWEQRTSLFGGVGYTVVKRADLEFNTRLGAGASYEFGSVNEVTPEALFGASLVRWNINDRQTLTASNTFYPSLGDWGEYRNVSNVEYKVKIDQADGISVKVGFANEYESEPEGDDERNSLKYYGALVVDF